MGAALCVNLAILSVALYVFCFGAVSRMLGGGVIQLPRLVDKVLFGVLAAMPFVIVSPAYWVVSLCVIAGSIILCNLGHLDFWYGIKDIRNQSVTFIAKGIYKAFFGTVDRTNWRYDAIGLALVGIAATLPCGIGFAYIGHPIIGLLVALSGASKAYAYRDGLSEDPAVLINATEKGEWRRGWYVGGFIALASILVLIIH